jgi:hypothetical protein
MGLSELKGKAVDLLIEAKFEGADTPEHQQAKEFWAENFEELRTV